MFGDMTIELPGGFSGLFKKKKKRGVGIDIGNSSIKIVELEKKEDGIFLKNYAITKVDKEGLIRPGSSKIISNDVGEIVKKIFNDIELKDKNINVAIPSFASLITTIELPPVSEKEIEQIIQVEAPKYIPVPLSEVVYGWEVVNSKQAKDETEDGDSSLLKASRKTPVKVVLASIMKNISQEYEKVFENSGYNIESLEVDTFALKRSMIGAKKGNFLIADIGSCITNISVISNGSVVVNRSIDVGGSRMTDLLSQAMKISKDRAEKIIGSQGLEIDSQDIKKQIMIPLLKNISDDIKKAKEGFEEGYPDSKLESILLTGGFSQMKGLKDFFSNQLGVAVADSNPWENLKYPDKIKDSLKSLSPYFGTAVGLALRGLIEE